MAPLTHSVTINPYPDKGDLTVLFSGNSRTGPLHQVGPQIRDHYVVHFIFSGKGAFSCMGREYDLNRGDSFFIFPGELTGYVSDAADPWEYGWIGFKGDRASELLSKIGISQHTPIVTANRQARTARLVRMIERTLQLGEPNCDLSSSGYMRLLLAEYARDRSVDNKRQTKALTKIEQQIEQAIRWMTLQYSQDISIVGMSRSLGYHHTHLSKMFKQHTGISPHNYLMKIRMERAKILMYEDLTIEQIASSVGFTDPFYFSKTFKKWYGRSPSDYRTELLAKERFDCMQ